MAIFTPTLIVACRLKFTTMAPGPGLQKSIEQQIVDLRNCTFAEIVQEIGCGRDRIVRTLRFWRAYGAVPEPLERGRPPKINKEIRDYIEMRTIQDARLRGGALIEEIVNRFHVQLHPTSIARVRHGLKFDFQPPRHCQHLTAGQMEERVEFCQRMLAQGDTVFKTICFSDESRVVLGNDKQWVWYRFGENNPSANVVTDKFPKALMIFAVIGIGYKSRLLFIEGTIDANQYIQNIADLGFIEDLDEKHGFLNWTFQQDGAPCHTATETMDWLEESVDVLSGWPANSPDLNPIELLWAILKAAVSRLRPQTIDGLKEVLQASWDRISQTTIDKLCSPFEARLTQCLEADGHSISKDLWRMGEKQAVIDYERTIAQRNRVWTEVETNRLIELHSMLGSRWARIASLLPGWTVPQLRNQWSKISNSADYRKKMTDVDWMMEMRGNARLNWPHVTILKD